MKCEVGLGFLSSASHLQMRIRRFSAQPQILDGIADCEVIKTLPIVPRQGMCNIRLFISFSDTKMMNHIIAPEGFGNFE